MPPTTATQPDSRATAPPQTMSREETINRQAAEIERLIAEAATDADRRAVLITRIAATDAKINELRTAMDDSGGSTTQAIDELRDLQRESTVLQRHLVERMQDAVGQRQDGGRSFSLDHFSSARDAADFAAYCIGRTRAGMRAADNDDHLRAAIESANTRALTGGAGSGDTYVIPQFEQTLIGTVKKFTGAFVEPRVFPMSGDKLTFGARAARVKGFRVGRAAAITESTPGTPVQSTLTAEKFGAMSFVASELLEDVNVLPALGDIIVEDMADSLAELFEREVLLGAAGVADTAFVTGEGYDPGNFYFDGIFGGAGFPTQTIASGTTFASATFTDLLTLIGGVDERFLASPSTKFHFHRSLLYHFMGVTDSQGRFLWQPPTDRAPGAIWGWPYQTWRSAPSTGVAAQNDLPFVAFGDMKRAYYVGVRRGLTISESSDFRYDTDELAIRGLARWAAMPAETAALALLKTNLF